MSSDRSNNTTRPPLKPTLSSTRTARTPLTPRVATPNATSNTKSVTSRAAPAPRSEPPTPRVKEANTPVNDVIANGNVTPRSSARTSRVSTPNTTPQKDDTPTAARPKETTAPAGRTSGSGSGLGLGIGASKTRANRPKSLVSDSTGSSRAQSPLVRSPGFFDIGQPHADETIETRFFHASDAAQQRDVTPKKPEPKKQAAFFYADGKQEQDREGQKTITSGATSPVLSAVSEKRSSAPWIRSDAAAASSKSTPLISPALSSLSAVSPFFAPQTLQPAKRSPSPSKENIHLSYRKGASQIIGTRPTPRSTDSSTGIQQAKNGSERKDGSNASALHTRGHQKSPSLSSIDSGNSHQSRRRSATTAEAEQNPSPLAHEVKAATIPRVGKAPNDPPRSIDISNVLPGFRSPEAPLSPTKGVSELAAEARRERKVLDLEISNSSLLAINASLEREVRRQKTELKRFRRLSRAGRFTFAPGDRAARLSEGLSAVGEEDEEDEDAMFGPASGLTDLYDDMSDDEESLGSSAADSLSPSQVNDRLAKDEKRLQVDLEKHKELLVQSQMMNQSLKRCTYATEEMIREGKKALDYHVRVSDVKLGGRVLSNHEDADEIEVEDDMLKDDSMDQAKGLLDVWAGIGQRSYEGSELGDRDSGIEVDRLPSTSLALAYKPGNMVADSGRPPGENEDAILGARLERQSLS